MLLKFTTVSLLVMCLNIQAVVKDITNANDLKQKGYVVAKFHGEAWCGPCKAYKPMFAKIEADYPDKATYYSIDTDTHGDISGEYKISGLPTTLIFKDGKEVARITGVNEEEVRSEIESFPAKPVVKEVVAVKTPKRVADSKPVKVVRQAIKDNTPQEISCGDDLTQSGYVVVKFYTNDCTLCVPYKEKFDKLANDNADIAKFYNANLANFPDLTEKYKILGVPRTLVLKDGKVIETIGGDNEAKLYRTLQGIRSGTFVKSSSQMVEVKDDSESKPAPKARKVTRTRKSRYSKYN